MRGKVQQGALLIVLSLVLLASFSGRTWSASQPGFVSILFTSNPVSNNIQETIAATPVPTASDGANIIINGLTVSTNANGAATYLICQNGQVNCYPPGSYTVSACDQVTNQCSTTLLTITGPIQPSVSLFIQYGTVNQGVGTSISATPLPNPGDGASILINGQVAVSNSGGPATLTCGVSSSPCYNTGSYTVVGCDLINNVCSSPQTLTVVPPGANTVECIINRSSSTTFDNCLSYALPIAMIGILFSLMLIAICYMLSEVVHIQALKGWYIGELKETAKSIMIIALIFASLVIMSGIAATLAGAAPATGSGVIQTNLGQSLYAAANNYLQNEVIIATTAYYFSAGAALGVNFIQSVQISTWVPIPLFPPIIEASLQSGSKENIFQSSIIDTTGKGANLSFLRDSLTFVIVPVLLAMQAQSMLLQSLIELGLLVFLPIGIILRAVPFLRGIGGTLIAIAIALALIYPTTLVAFNQPVTNFVNGAISNQLTYACSFHTGFGILDAFLNDIICNFVYAGFQYNAGVNAGVSSITSIYPLFNGVMFNVLPLLIQFILMVLDIVIVVTLAAELARILGGNLRLSLGKFKLA